MSPQSGEVVRDCLDCPEMVVIPAGSFEMGSNSYDHEKPVHRVTIGKAFAMGKTPVTEGQWRAIMGNNPSYFQNHGNHYPVQRVNWNDAQEFIRKLNAKTGQQYRLPSEAEWEYACRAGGQQEYSGSDDIESVAWYYYNSDHTMHPVATKQANAWGLYDMLGDVWEWVEDGWHDNYIGAPADGSVWQGGGSRRVTRGGSWNVVPDFAQPTFRLWYGVSDTFIDLGFRVARTIH